MAAAALDNANPTVLNASELPSRQKRSAPRKGPESKYSDLVFSKPSFLFDSSYFSASSGSETWSDESADEEDEFVAAAIDEQEIYGTSTPPPPT